MGNLNTTTSPGSKRPPILEVMTRSPAIAVGYIAAEGLSCGSTRKRRPPEVTSPIAAAIASADATTFPTRAGPGGRWNLQVSRAQTR